MAQPPLARHLRSAIRPIVNRETEHAEILDTLGGLFYGSVQQLGTFQPVERDSIPAAYAQLLVHDQHMTVTVEAFYGSPVNVQVLERYQGERSYSRAVVLTRRSDGRVVQFGIVRLKWMYLDPIAEEAIRSEQIPLGRILIRHHVLRRVEPLRFYRVRCTGELARFFATDRDQVTYGRTARIFLDGEPAVELVEIVAPVECETP